MAARSGPLTLIEQVEAALARHRGAVAVVAGAWFWLGVATAAGFVTLPKFLALPPALIMGSGIVVNALWWGAVRPMLEQRRRAREGGKPDPGAG